MTTRFEHTSVVAEGHTFVDPKVLKTMSEQGWELVAVNAQAAQWRTFCVSYWKRPVQSV